MFLIPAIFFEPLFPEKKYPIATPTAKASPMKSGIKTENLLLDDDFNLKISDFGFAQIL